MSSKIENIIDEIEDYINSCKNQPLSTTKVIVNREEMEALLTELRMNVPEEIKKYQKIISNQQAILTDAKSQADSMLAEAENKTNDMVSEHEIMQRAYAEANNVIEQANAQAQATVDNATAQAQAIVDHAVAEANGLRQSSVQYTDEMLRTVQTIIRQSMDGAQTRFDSLYNSLQNSLDTVTANRSELANTVVAGPETEEA